MQYSENAEGREDVLELGEEIHHALFKSISKFNKNNKQRRNTDFPESSMSNFSTSQDSSLIITYPCSLTNFSSLSTR